MYVYVSILKRQKRSSTLAVKPTGNVKRRETGNYFYY